MYIPSHIGKIYTFKIIIYYSTIMDSGCQSRVTISPGQTRTIIVWYIKDKPDLNLQHLF